MKDDSVIEKYIRINKNDIITYFIVFLFATIVLFIIAKKSNFYFILLLDIFFINSVVSRINTRITLKSIENFLYSNNIYNKLGKIEFWNEKNYFLTENYIIIKIRKDIDIISYSEIEYIYYNNDVSLNMYNSYVDKYLHVILKDKKEYKFLVNSTLLTDENTKDIGKYLINKNKDIKLLKNGK